MWDSLKGEGWTRAGHPDPEPYPKGLKSPVSACVLTQRVMSLSSLGKKELQVWAGGTDLPPDLGLSLLVGRMGDGLGDSQGPFHPECPGAWLLSSLGPAQPFY